MAGKLPEFNDGFLYRPRRYSWEDAIVNKPEPILDDDLVRNAVSALDLIVAVLNQEISRVRECIPRISVADFWRFVKTKLPKVQFQSFINVFKWFAGNQNRMLQGNEVCVDSALAKLDFEDFSNTFSDDDDDASSFRAASTVCSQTNDKRISDLEAQLSELKQTLQLLVQTGASVPGQPSITNKTDSATISKAALSALPQLSNNPKKESCAIATVSKAAPPAPPPPPPSLFKPKPSNPVRKVASIESIDENKPPPTQKIGLNLGELGSVKLKKIARTPGGTPIRQVSESDRSDLVGCLAKALKQKFRNADVSAELSEHDAEDSEDWDDEPIKTKLT